MRATRKSGADDDIASLQDADLVMLRALWAEYYGTAPLARISRELLIRGVAYRLQEQAQGGLEKPVLKRLRAMAKDLESTSVIDASPVATFKPGTKLVREWKGQTHEVLILEDGFAWTGRRYASLSQIARLITGTRWSGPRFFGLEPSQLAEGKGG